MNYAVIEVNPRVSRSSALASKATGYPIARMAAKIAIGRRLDELINPVTQKTTAAFEPALDYVVAKIPRWPFDKFNRADRTIGTQMKATGEVMAIDRSFEGALQKAVRSLETDAKDLALGRSELDRRNDPGAGRTAERSSAVGDCGRPAARRRRRDDPLPEPRRSLVPQQAGWAGRARAAPGERGPHPRTCSGRRSAPAFSDKTIARLANRSAADVESLRETVGMFPVYKMVDTCAGEFAAATPYFYSTYEEEDEAVPIEGPRTVVVGSGPIRIGQGIEFDYSAVQAAHALHDGGVASIMINSNPETVSTDFDASDRLYFEPLDEESVAEVLRHESGGDTITADVPVIVQFGGQTAINLAEPLARRGVPILGSQLDSIDLAEDRHRFEGFLRELGIPQPPGAAVTSLADARTVAGRIGFPVLVRPSYVLGGRAMEVVYGQDQLARYIRNAADLHP